MYGRPVQVQTKVHSKRLHFLAVTHDIGFFTLCYRRCRNGSGLFDFFKIFLETEMSKSPPIIVRECVLKNQNLCFAPR